MCSLQSHKGLRPISQSLVTPECFPGPAAWAAAVRQDQVRLKKTQDAEPGLGPGRQG